MTVEDWLALGWTRAEAERYAQRSDTMVEVLVADGDGSGRCGTSCATPPPASSGATRVGVRRAGAVHPA